MISDFLKGGSSGHVEGVFEGNHTRDRQTTWKSFVLVLAGDNGSNR